MQLDLRFAGLLVLAAVLLVCASPASAIVIRHDRDDADYRSLGERSFVIVGASTAVMEAITLLRLEKQLNLQLI